MKKYRFGECIPESIKVYNRLKKQGKMPIFVEGWVEVDYQDLLPDLGLYRGVRLFYGLCFTRIKSFYKL